MNEVDKNKLIIHTSWLYEAITCQYRSLMADVKRCLLFSHFKMSQIFANYIKNLKLSSVLISQSHRNYTNLVKSTILNKRNMETVYNLYVKRGLYHEQIAYEFLNNLKFDILFTNDGELKKITAKMMYLHNMLIQLEQNFYKLQLVS